MTETFLLRLRTDRLAPDYQDGDVLEVEPADAADHGAWISAPRTQTVVGLVKRMFRKVGPDA